MDRIAEDTSIWTKYLDRFDTTNPDPISISFRNNVGQALEKIIAILEQQQDLAKSHPNEFDVLKRLKTRQEHLLDSARAQNAELSSSIYTKVDEAAGEIRLVTILPGQVDDAIQCNLEVVSLNNRCPDFRALSYAWGSPLSPLEEIILGGRKFPIIRNLASAIRTHLRCKDQPVTYWVDAICINQSDLEERSSQVQYMRYIYANASEVVAWLGDEEEGSADGMILMSQLGESIIEHPNLLKLIEAKLRRGSMAFKSIADSAIGQSLMRTLTTNPSAWHSVLAIDDRSYWRRAWAIQETALTNNLRIVCGHHSMGWRSFRNAQMVIVPVIHRLLLQNPRYMTKKYEDGFRIVKNAREEIQSNKAVTLSQTILTLRPCLATDPRDKVFAFLGLQNGVKFPINYLKPVRTVYREIAKTLIQENMSLDILTGCHMKHKIPSLPSWVPDWSVSNIQRGNILTYRVFTPRSSKLTLYASSGAAAPIMQFSEDLDKLTVAGIYLDCIAEVSESAANNRLFDSALVLWENFKAKIPQEIDAEMKQLKTRYADNFWRTLIVDRPSPTGLQLQYRIHESQALSYKAQFEILFQLEIFSTIDPASNPNPTADQRGVDFCSDYIFALSLGKKGRRLAVTEKQYFAMVPDDAEVGDLICILLGAQGPFVLKAVGENFQLVGDCFAQGFMDGEIMDEVNEGRLVIRDFVLV